jgi:quercetin dioxygenase-like cupin family protein
MIHSAEVVLPCDRIEHTLNFFRERLGFRLELILPAEDPASAVLAGHGLRIRLQRGAEGTPGVLRIVCDDPAAVGGGEAVLTAPNGTRVELVAEDPPLALPALRPSFVVSRAGEGAWGAGRAGMLYRDLLPDRQGGRFVASHIRIPDGGPVPDYVHYHRVRFQLIYCRRGWVRLVYEDQGPPFVLRAGDCVLQPPLIRHRVLECSPGLEVIELGSPAEHETLVEHQLGLPTPQVHPQRDFSGQRFVRHQAAEATWSPWRLDGFEARDTGIADATGGLATVRVARVVEPPGPLTCSHDAELLFTFVLEGGLNLARAGHDAERLAAGDAFAVPAGTLHTLSECAPDLELLEVALPGDFHTSQA